MAQGFLVHWLPHPLLVDWEGWVYWSGLSHSLIVLWLPVRPVDLHREIKTIMDSQAMEMDSYEVFLS